MMKMRKNGISAVVATVLIILITVAAVTIIWSAVIPMIKDNLEAGDDCMKAQSEVSIGTTGYTCIVNNTAGNISVQVTHGPSDFELVEIQLIVHNGGDSDSKILNKDNFGGSLPGKNQAKIAYVVNTSYQNASKIEIAPVLKVGNTKKNCGVSSSADLQICDA